MGRRRYLDLPRHATDAPNVGDVLLGARHAHRIVDVWPTSSKVWPNRWTIVVEPLGPYAPDDLPPCGDGARYRTWRPYRRGEGPTTPGVFEDRP